MRDDENSNIYKQPMSRRDLCVSLLVAGVFFGYLAIATVFHDSPTVRLVMIGPYGISFAIWLCVGFVILGVLARRERDRPRR